MFGFCSIFIYTTLRFRKQNNYTFLYEIINSILLKTVEFRFQQTFFNRYKYFMGNLLATNFYEANIFFYSYYQVVSSLFRTLHSKLSCRVSNARHVSTSWKPLNYFLLLSTLIRPLFPSDQCQPLLHCCRNITRNKNICVMINKI